MVLNLFDPCATWVYPSSNYSVSGTVRNTNGAGLPNVTISAGGGHSTVSGSTGAYTISGLAAGNYTLTPSLSGYTFNPPSRSITIAAANLTDQDFTGSSVAPPPSQVTYLPLLRRESTNNPPPSGPQDGYWANSSTGYPQFSVASNGTQVVDFTIYISVTGCGSYTIKHNGSEPINANGFAYNNTFYFNGTFNSTTSASGIFGLASFYIDGCGYVSTTHDMSWSADWQHAQLNDSLSP
jgi:hypothetical protein